jgi:hypothetical protein
MTDLPGMNPGDPMGKREYEIQLLVPNKHRDGERWRALGEPYNEVAKAEYAVDDIVSSMADVIGRERAQEWAAHRVRVMEKVTTVVYGKQMAVSIKF